MALSNNHKNGIRVLLDEFSSQIHLEPIYQSILHKHNRQITGKYTRANIPDSHPALTIWHDLAIFETAAIQSVESLMSAINRLMQPREAPMPPGMVDSNAPAAPGAASSAATATSAPSSRYVKESSALSSAPSSGCIKKESSSSSALSLAPSLGRVKKESSSSTSSLAPSSGCIKKSSSALSSAPSSGHVKEEAKEEEKPLATTTLWACLKYIEVKFTRLELGSNIPKANGTMEGAHTSIDIISPGWCWDGNILSPAFKAFLFTFWPSNHDKVVSIIDSHANLVQWVNQGYAVPLLSSYKKVKINEITIEGVSTNAVLRARKQMMRRWQEAVKDIRVLAFWQLAKGALQLSFELKFIQKSYQVEIANMIAREAKASKHGAGAGKGKAPKANTVEASKHKVSEAMKELIQRDIANIQAITALSTARLAMPEQEIRDPIPEMIRGLRNHTFTQAHATLTRSSYRDGVPLPGNVDSLLESTTDDLKRALEAILRVMGGVAQAGDKALVAYKTKPECHHIMTPPPPFPHPPQCKKLGSSEETVVYEEEHEQEDNLVGDATYSEPPSQSCSQQPLHTTTPRRPRCRTRATNQGGESLQLTRPSNEEDTMDCK
ncbi:hypothetical protein FOMPIDRAFT_88604 [Fomitopsis schrenkii]|uniref:Uncharacterized protein n=1 Tax=Fomitopsis schrenkii TaxID=2126942 RepID=S8E4M2_FOMSC|nr:hypothetical protein FOMPIDRAFT_88604 [Fomitopsis schrenkii]